MIKYLAASTALLFLIVNAAKAQLADHFCAATKGAAMSHLRALKGTIADGGEALYDVKYVKLDIALGNLNADIKGNAFTIAKSNATLATYVFELTTDLIVDSIKIDGINRTFTATGDVVKANLSPAIPANTSFQAQVFYHGTIVAGTGFFDRGLRNLFSGAANKRYTFTLTQPYGAKDFYPCKQDLQDKIDSSDVWITVDSSLKAGSNGILTQITNISPLKRRYEWKNRNPIDYYLISAAVGPYDEYRYYMHFNSTDSMLVQNYIYQNTLSVRKPILDSTALMIDYFSQIFTRYPFWKEKYGHCQIPVSGGMEHQTMTSLGIWTDDVVPHELAHQWFGDNVTCATWKDIWLNEGFASYGEYLYNEHFKGPVQTTAKMLNVHLAAMGLPMGYDATGAVYVDDTTDQERIFSSRLSYNKGGSAVHSLRFEANDDTVFFNMLRNWQTQFGGKTATTEQFKDFVAAQYGRNMDTFFNQWIYASGWPIYNATWNQQNNLFMLKLDQQATGNYTSFKYSTPLEVQLSGPLGDTIVRLYTNTAATAFSFNWAKPVTAIAIDPNDWLLDEPGMVVRDNSLGLSAMTTGTDAVVYPNPFHSSIQVKHTKPGTFWLTDIAGKQLLSTLLGQEPVKTINLQPFATGIYLYRIVGEDGMVQSQGKLVKQ